MSGPTRRTLGRGLRAIAACAFALAVAPALSAPAGDAPPTFAEVRAAFRPSEAVLLDRGGTVLATARIDRSVRRLDWVALDEVSPALVAAVVAGEDKRFFEHDGVDWTGLAIAAWDSAWRVVDGRRPRGGSTLTMQLAGLVDPALRARGGEARTLGQKWDQASAALAIEERWSKREVLEAYLNLSSYRGELVGIGAAARGLFAKAPSGLDARESAVLVALLRGPSAQPAIVARRACSVALALAPLADCDAVRATASTALAGGNRLQAREDLAPHLAARLLRVPGERLVTTLDANTQAFAQATLVEHLSALADRGVGDGAIVVLDNASGEVLAWVGSSGELSGAPQVDGVLAPRQAGSTLKPFLYALAIDDARLTAASLVDDSPLAIPTARGVYAPQNYDRSFRGLVSVRTALAGSLNVPAVRTLELVGLDRFHDTLRALGFDSLTEAPDHYGAALALGGADVTLLALANAYRALANGGVWSASRTVAAGTGAPMRTPIGPGAEGRRVLGAAASFVVADILSDRGARATTFGLENPLATRVWSAVKTGTSKDMRDNWCVGFTSRYTVGVWVGNFSGAPMHDVSGVTGAAPVWRDVVHFLHREAASRSPVPPRGLVRANVSFDPPVEAGRDEWFVSGTAMAIVRAVPRTGDVPEAALAPRIRYPAPDTIIALDPDIPAAHQRIAFVASDARPGHAWTLDGRALEGKGERALWTPAPGRHVVALHDDAGDAIASVAFEVRGSP